MPSTDDLDVDAMVEKCRMQSSLTGMIDNPGNMFRSVTKLADEVSDLREQNRRLWNAAQRVMNKCNTAHDTWESVPVSTLEDLGAAMRYSGEGK